jgi:hypothetical protein
MKGLEPSTFCMANVSWIQHGRAPERLNLAVSALLVPRWLRAHIGHVSRVFRRVWALERVWCPFVGMPSSAPECRRPHPRGTTTSPRPGSREPQAVVGRATELPRVRPDGPGHYSELWVRRLLQHRHVLEQVPVGVAEVHGGCGHPADHAGLPGLRPAEKASGITPSDLNRSQATRTFSTEVRNATCH